MPLLTLDRLAFGGEAVGRLEGKAVFVALGAPGDVAEVRLDEERARWARGTLLGLETPGPERTTPCCPHFGHCGGCQWQHLTLEAQRAAKRMIVAEQLLRIGGLHDADVAEVEAGPAWAYRDRVTLACVAGISGLRAARSHALVTVDACPIATDAVASHLPRAAALAQALGDVRRVTVVARGASDTGVVLVATGGRPSAAAAEAARAAAPRTVRGVVWRSGRRRVTTGAIDVSRTLEPGLDLIVPGDVFTQPSGWAHAALVRSVVSAVGPCRGLRVLDLYCGAGTLSLPLALRGARVAGVERDRVAVAAARANARRLAVSAFDVDAADATAAVAGAPPADVVILDPPRRGAAGTVEALLARRPPRIVYVSCDPATFARDVGRLVRGGYALGPVQPLDVFPQTYHVEIVAPLRLT